MLRSEKRSLIRFLLIYLLSTFILFALASWMFYVSGKHHILDRQRKTLKYEAEHIETQLRKLHRSDAKILVYPNSPHIHSAIYDVDKHYIFGSFPKIPALEHLDKKGTLYYVAHLEPYFLGAAYLLVAMPVNHAPIEALQKNIFIFMLVGGIVFLLLGYYLGRLFVAPMRDSIHQMNRFIQDTTHELNTPISTILTNIEMIETLGKHEENRTELQRIALASKTLSRIYDDLTYLNLNHQYHRHIVSVDIGRLVEERMLYFSAAAEVKFLKIERYIAKDVKLQIDKNDALRLVDNLLSNAIKYNKTGGMLTIEVTPDFFIVKDTGTGIKKENMRMILERFKRENSSEGGFGIGLDIVNQVVKAYGFALQIYSREGKGTEMRVRWGK